MDIEGLKCPKKKNEQQFPRTTWVCQLLLVEKSFGLTCSTHWPCSLMFPHNGINHKAAITVDNHCLLLSIAALYFILCCGHIQKHGRTIELEIKILSTVSQQHCDEVRLVYTRHLVACVHWLRAVPYNASPKIFNK